MIRRHDDSESSTTAVTIAPGAVGAHVGIRYAVTRATGAKRVRHLHLAFHHELRDEDWESTTASWITPGFSDPLGTVRTLAALVANTHADGRVPYALRADRATIDATTGEVQLNGSLGLSCSTLVLRLFAAARLPLVVESSWDARSAARISEDTGAQLKLVEYLRRHDPDHANAVANEIGCTRIRAEEVAAASGRPEPPAEFADVVEIAADLLVQLAA